MKPVRFDSVDALAGEIIDRLAGNVVLGLPLGLGKPVALVDALYERALSDSSVQLTVLTALTLERPKVGGSGLRARFIGPILDRSFAGYQSPRYAVDQARDALPSNVQVIEFYVAPGSRLRSGQSQQSHASVNYTHAARMVRSRGVNVVAQLVRETEAGLSLSCNPDVTLDLLGEGAPLLVGQPHSALPDMGGEARLPAAAFDYLLDADPQPLPSIPDQPVTEAQWLLGLNASALVPDGGTLQIGIGGLGDAICGGLLLRHRHNAIYRSLMEGRFDAPIVERVGGLGAFDEGLHGCSEMLVEGMVTLLRAGIIRRRAADGAAIHAGFFLGPRRLLETMNAMEEEERAAIRMKPISFINDIVHDFEQKSADRRDARFLNTAMLVTLGGAACSDGLEDGRVVSGVGGQFDFVTMAHALPGGRSVIMVPAVREHGGDVESNIRYAYGHVTIPRHLRDLVVTEYGIADLRDRTDAEVADALLQITDARFVDALRDEAVSHKKLPKDYRVSDRARANTPDALRDRLAPHRAHFDRFPLGSDWTEVELQLLEALERLAAHPIPHARDLRAAVSAPKAADPYLERMGLADPEGLREHALQRLLLFALSASNVIY